ncbi:MAG: glycosyltransferase [Betaproteobacteria bacterium]
MKRILLVIDHLGVGGVQEFFLNVVRDGRELARFTVLSLFANDVYSQRLREAGAEVIFCSERDYNVVNVARLSGIGRYRAYLRDNAGRFDRIHVRLFAAFLYSSLIGLYRRKGVSAGLDAGRRQLPWYVFAVFVVFARKYETFFIPAAYWDEYGALRLRPGQLAPVQYLVTDRRAAKPAALQHRRNVLTIGRCIPQKGFLEVIGLFARMSALTREDIGLFIIGDGPDRPRLEQEVASRGLRNVHCVGTVLELDPYMAAADMVIKMAFGEGINSVVRESLLAGKVVAMTLETEECREFADAGLVVPIDRAHPDAAARRLVAFLEGRERIDVARAVERVQSSGERLRIVNALC